MTTAQRCNCCQQNPLMLVQDVDDEQFNVWVCPGCDSVKDWPTINGTDVTQQ